MIRNLAWFRSLSWHDFLNGAVLDEIEAVFNECDALREKLAVADEMFNRQADGFETENRALRKEVNELRAKLGCDRKYVEWDDNGPRGGCPVSGGIDANNI
jgi:hypothetical protein